MAARDAEMAGRDPLMQPSGLWKEPLPFEDPIPGVRRGKDAFGADGAQAPGGGGEESAQAWMLESGFFPQGGKGPQISMFFYFVTSWVFFVQGIGGLSNLAVSYFYKDTLGVEPATLSMVMSMTAIPWTIKPLYGFMSDGWPIFGYRRKPYMIIAGAMASLSWFCMAVLVNDVWFGFTVMFFGSMGVAVTNVIAEGMLVEKSRGQTQEFASHLQAYVYGAQAIGGIIAAYFGGFLLSYLADRHVFMLCCLFPLTLIFVAFALDEERFDGDVTAIRADMGGKLAELFQALKNPQIYKPVAVVFMLNGTPSTGSTWFYFYTGELHFTSSFMGTINVVGAICSLGGVVIFGKFETLNPKPRNPKPYTVCSIGGFVIFCKFQIPTP